MKPTLNKADLELMKDVFPTKGDLKTELVQSEKRIIKLVDEKIKRSERRIIRRVDFVDKTLDREHVKLAKEVGDIKHFVGYNGSN